MKLQFFLEICEFSVSTHFFIVFKNDPWIFEKNTCFLDEGNQNAPLGLENVDWNDFQFHEMTYFGRIFSRGGN